MRAGMDMTSLASSGPALPSAHLLGQLGLQQQQQLGSELARKWVADECTVEMRNGREFKSVEGRFGDINADLRNDVVEVPASIHSASISAYRINAVMHTVGNLGVCVCPIVDWTNCTVSSCHMLVKCMY